MAFSNDTDVDVAICGGGLAGLLLARQLRLEQPDVSIAVIDRLTRPLPEGTLKVGESTVELSSHYLRDVVQMADHLDSAQLRKLGLRFFFPGGDALESRPEVGLSDFATVPSYQIDRGILEEELRNRIDNDGVRMIEGARVTEIALGEDGAAHQITYQPDEAAPQTLTARWVVDASGRKQTLQRQLGLVRRREAGNSAVWFRIDGELMLDDMVPAENTDWHARVPERRRWFSTNHLVGQGYWVWIIPLPGQKTSIGIVTDESYHPLDTFQTRAKATTWLEQHEPAFAAHLKNFEWLDFGAVKNYTHSSSQIYSGDRWACVGDASVFADPMYSPGSDLIGFSNSCVSQMVGADLEGRFTPKMASDYSRFVISLCELLTRTIQINYHLLGSAPAMAAKFYWDFCAGWSFVHPMMFGGYFRDPEMHAAVRGASKDFFFRSLQMNQMFKDWAEKSQGHVTYDFIDYLKVDGVRDMRARNLVPGKPLDALIEDQKQNLTFMEDLAQVLFRVAVADCFPGEAHRLEGRWLNPTRMTLRPEDWDRSGLFDTKTPPRDLSYLQDQIFAMFNLRPDAKPPQTERSAA